jgi:hypothetical protein
MSQMVCVAGKGLVVPPVTVTHVRLKRVDNLHALSGVELVPQKDKAVPQLIINRGVQVGERFHLNLSEHGSDPCARNGNIESHADKVYPTLL